MTGPIRSNTSSPALRPVKSEPAAAPSAATTAAAPESPPASSASTFTAATPGTAPSRPTLNPVGSPLVPAASAAPLRKLSSVLGPVEDGPIGFPAPAGVKPSVAADITDDVLELPGGQKPGFWWNEQRLSVKRADGSTVDLVPADAARQEATHRRFRELAPALAAKAPAEPTAGHFIASRQLSGYGTAGALMSLTVTTSRFDGQGEAVDTLALQTFDTRTGKPVRLDALLSPAQFAQVVDTISRELPTLQRTDGPGFDAKPFVPASRQALEDLVARQFALVTRGGKVQLDVALTAKNLELGTARFTFEAPTDAGFAQAIGADALAPVGAPKPAKATTDALDALRARVTDPGAFADEAAQLLKEDPVAAGLTQAGLEKVLEALRAGTPAAAALATVFS